MKLPIDLSKPSIALPTRRRTPASELTELIHSKELKPGDRLPSIRQMAIALGVSHSSARDAYKQLQAMGLIKVHPRSGAFVQASRSRSQMFEPASPDSRATVADFHLLHLLDARRVIEVEVAAIAAENRRLEDLHPVRQALESLALAMEQNQFSSFLAADIQFHVALARAAGNSVLTILVQSLSDGMAPLLLRSQVMSSTMQRAQQEHKQIYEAVLAGDAASARTAMLSHLELAQYIPLSIDRLPGDN